MSTKTRTKGDVGQTPGAHPTAPGGMSQAALTKELVEKHGWSTEDATFPRAEWAVQIDAVCVERRNRELEVEAEMKAKPKSMTPINKAILEDIAAELTEELAEVTALVDDLEEFEDLLAEFEDVFDPEPHPATDPNFVQTEPVKAQSMLICDPDTYDFVFDGHAGAGPSGAERWMNCTASLGAARAFLETLTPNQQIEFAGGSEAARQGTTAHAAAEAEARVVLGEIKPHEAQEIIDRLRTEPPEGEEFTDEMADYIAEYVDLIQSYAVEDPTRIIRVESRVSAAIPLTGSREDEAYEVHGSADVTVYPTPKDPTLVVGDLKYGAGLDVDAEENPQARIYALGVLSELADEDGNLPHIETITYLIIQPRLGGIKPWSESLDDLLDWRDDVLAPALTAALYGESEGAAFSPSEVACQWCPARGSCAALAEKVVADGAELFDAIVEAEVAGEEFLETERLSDARLGALYAQIKALTNIEKSLKEETQRRLNRGAQIPGFKLVTYQPPRKWRTNAEGALAEMEELWVRKLRTPKQASDLLTKTGDERVLAGLIDSPEAVPVVSTGVGDKRREWAGVAPESMFGIEDE